MIKSMTGFGQGEHSASGWHAEVTIRTVNHRYLSVRVRSLSNSAWLQAKVEKLIKHSFGRGEIEVRTNLTRNTTSSGSVLFDRHLIADYLDDLRNLCTEFSLDTKPTLSDLIELGALCLREEEDEDLWKVVKPAVEQAISNSVVARQTEGERLASEVQRFLREISSLLEDIVGKLPAIVKNERQRLNKRIHELEIEVDPERIESEIALLAERNDVQEEIARLRAHVQRATDLLMADDPRGKELSFLGQELLREANTLGSKTRDIPVNSLVVDMKLEIERFREQVRNIE